MSVYDEVETKLKQILLIVIALGVVFKVVIYPKFHDPMNYKSSSFSFTIPVGWERYKIPEMEKNNDKKSHVQAVIIAPSEQVARIRANKKKTFKDMDVGTIPDTLIRFMAVRLEHPVWLDVHWEDILQEIAKSGLLIKDYGQLMMQEEIVKWVLCETPGANKRIILEFYLAPPQQSGKLLKMEFLTTPQNFAKYRPGFEEARGSFKF